MNPPIPEPSVAPRPFHRGPRPETMKYFIAADVLFTMTGIVYCDGTLTSYSVAADLIVYFGLSVMWLALLWALWIGLNWSRVVLMVLCAISILSVFSMGEDTPLQQGLSIIDAVFRVAMIWWLRTPAVVAFTKGKPA